LCGCTGRRVDLWRGILGVYWPEWGHNRTHQENPSDFSKWQKIRREFEGSALIIGVSLKGAARRLIFQPQLRQPRRLQARKVVLPGVIAESVLTASADTIKKPLCRRPIFIGGEFVRVHKPVLLPWCFGVAANTAQWSENLYLPRGNVFHNLHTD